MPVKKRLADIINNASMQPPMGMSPPVMAPMQPAPGDDTIISADTGEFIFPKDVVNFLGVDRLNKMIEQAKQKMAELDQSKAGQQGNSCGGVIKPKGYALGGLVTPDEQQPPIGSNLFDAANNYMVKNSPLTQAYNQTGLVDAGNINAYVQSSEGFNPIRMDKGGAMNYDETPMSLSQVAGLDKAWSMEPINQLPQRPFATVKYSSPDKIITRTVYDKQGNPHQIQDVKSGSQSVDLVDALPNGRMPGFMHPGGGNVQPGLSLADFQKQADTLSIANNPAMATTINPDMAVMGPSGAMITDPATKMKLLEAKLANSLAVQQARNEGMLQAATARGRANGFNEISPEDSALIEKGIAEGRIDPSRINSRTAKIFAQMERSGGGKTNYVGASGNVKYQNAQSNLNSRALAEGVNPLYDKLLVAGKALGNTSIPGVNRIVNWSKEQTGNPEIVAFNNLRDDVIAESERVLLGSGVLSDSKYMRAVKNVNSAQSYPQLQAAMNQLKSVVNTRLEALNIKPFQTKMGAAGVGPTTPTNAAPAGSPMDSLRSKYGLGGK